MLKNAYFCKTEMKAIQKIVPVQELSTVTEFKLMFVLFCFSLDLLICASKMFKFICKAYDSLYNIIF